MPKRSGSLANLTGRQDPPAVGNADCVMRRTLSPSDMPIFSIPVAANWSEPP